MNLNSILIGSAEPQRLGEMPDAWIATFADPDDNYFQLMSPLM